MTRQFVQMLHEAPFACSTLAADKYWKARTNDARDLPLEFLHLRTAAKEEHRHSTSTPLKAGTQFPFQNGPPSIGTFERNTGGPASQFFAMNAKIFAYFARYLGMEAVSLGAYVGDSADSFCNRLVVQMHGTGR
jgi:hypothetical protein